MVAGKQPTFVGAQDASPLPLFLAGCDVMRGQAGECFVHRPVLSSR